MLPSISISTILLAYPFYEVCLARPQLEIDPSLLLISLGSVEGKTFFYHDSSMAWAAAKVYCQDFGMRLGRISSQAQMTFLVGKNNITGFGGLYHWTAGRDAMTMNQFLWDDQLGPVSSYGQSVSFSTPLTCLAWVTRPSSGAWLSSSCRASAHVLCETF
ncbi:uncharacterized protein LOC110855990 [Folsomia candida]|uniref:Snaclec CHH-B subunit beta n=1 Tax=Folsomia candida TaxID=158441 RepID=A0A226DNF2_FOLCA|nr:uncharacterized protein LOC110855990 [Folsomia candida]OXA47062.1 Snaclec CHH-B subunit beta [Folsomia candida]